MRMICNEFCLPQWTCLGCLLDSSQFEVKWERIFVWSTIFTLYVDFNSRYMIFSITKQRIKYQNYVDSLFLPVINTDTLKQKCTTTEIKCKTRNTITYYLNLITWYSCHWFAYLWTKWPNLTLTNTCGCTQHTQKILTGHWKHPASFLKSSIHQGVVLSCKIFIYYYHVSRFLPLKEFWCPLRNPQKGNSSHLSLIYVLGENRTNNIFRWKPRSSLHKLGFLIVSKACKHDKRHGAIKVISFYFQCKHKRPFVRSDIYVFNFCPS